MYKTFTPIYDTELVQKWYLDQRLNENIFLVGEIKTITSSSIPEGWLLCNGDNISRTRYRKLFDTIGTDYGSGDGSTTFTLPTYTDSVSVLGYKIIKY